VADVLGGFQAAAATLSTALGDWQSAVLTALQYHVPPLALTLAPAAKTSTVASVKATSTSTGPAALPVPKTQAHVVTTTLGVAPAAGTVHSLAKADKAPDGNKVATVGIGHSTGAKTGKTK